MLRRLFSRESEAARRLADDIELLHSSPLVDPVWYRETYADLRDTPVDVARHYLEHGAREGRNPGPGFDTRFYLQQNPDVAASGLNPLVHYILHGVKEGRDPHPFGLRRIFDWLVHRADHLAPSNFDDFRPDPDEFDEDAYLTSYPDLKVALEKGIIPSGREHWMIYGFYEELNGSRDGSWRKAVSLSTIKAMINSIASQAQTTAVSLEHPETSLPKSILPYVKRWNKASRTVKALPQAPLISVLMPVYNVDVKWLNLAIESVSWQIYPNWELCIVDDCSPNKEISELLQRWAARDRRIKLRLRKENGHISAATNDALAIAEGSYIALLDHDDELTVDALARVAHYINNHNDVDYIYSDEDKVDVDGNVSGRFFKPAWSPEFVLSCGYTTHLSVYRKSIVSAVGGFRSQFDGAQDYDLTLRVVETTSKVGHIPEVLYHWRTIATSTASGNQTKNYAYPRAKAALKEHMSRIGFPGQVVDGVLPGYTRPVFNIKGDPLVSLIIPTAGKAAELNGRNVNLLQNFIQSIRQVSTWKNIQLIVLENGNLTAETIGRLSDLEAVLIPYREERFNLARKINLGVQHADGEYVIILNDDMEVISPDWIEQLLQFQQQEGVGVVGAKLLFANRTIQHIGVTVVSGNPGHPYYGAPEGTVGHGGICTAAHNTIAVTGACSMTPKKLFTALGGYDDAFDLNYNDVDYCLRLIDAGYRVVMNPFAVLLHYESLSRDHAGGVRPEELSLFHRRWRNRYQREIFMRGI